MKNLRKTISFILAVLLCLGTVTVCFPAVLAAGTEYYVDATNGNDSNAGTQAAPFKTIQKAKTALGTSAGTVHIADGEYFIGETLTWTSGSGTQEWIADGDNVIFTGSTKLQNGWTEATLNGVSCLKRTFDTSMSQIMLYDDGSPLKNSRMPDSGYYYLEDGADPQSSNATFAQNLGVITKTADTSAIGSSGQTFGADARAFIRIYHYWMEELLVIDSYNASTGKIAFNQSYDTSWSINTSAANDPYCLENVIAGFNESGEWYMDYPNKTLYYIPRTGESSINTSIYMASTEKLININGASNIHFQGIEFKGTTDVYTGNYSQSAYGSHSAITVTNASGIKFTSCKFRNIGSSAINFGDWSDNANVHDCEVKSCNFCNIGASAIVVSGGNNANCPYSINIQDNLVMNYGKNRAQACGIFVTHAHDITIQNNEVHDGMYTAISVGWSWGYNATNNYNNKINNNLIYYIGHGPMSDMGGIYVLGIQTNSEIKNNVISDVVTGDNATTYGGWGIYTDEGSQGWTISNNICYDCGSQGFHQHYGYHNTVSNNIFAFNEDGQVRSSARWVSCANAGNAADESGENKNYAAQTTDGDQFYLYNDILVGDNQNMYHNYQDNYFTDNNCIYWDYTLEAEVVSQGSKSTKSSIVNSGNTNNYGNGVFENPLFIDAENRNFNFSAMTTANKISFTAIDVSNVGSTTYKSKYLVNDLAQVKGAYDSELWDAWESAKDNARFDNTLTVRDELEDAYNSLAVMDQYAQYIIDFERYHYGPEYEAYLTAYNNLLAEVRENGTATTATVNAISSAYSTLTGSTFTITLNQGSYGSISSSDATKTYTYATGTSITLPTPTLSNTDYKFIGWERSTDGEILDAGSYVAGSGSYTLTAKYGQAWTLQLYPNGGTLPTNNYSGGSSWTDDQDGGMVAEGESLYKYLHNMTPIRSGYRFMGWRQSVTNIMYDENSVMPGTSLTLNAVWQEFHTVYFDNLLYDAYVAGWNQSNSYLGYSYGNDVDGSVIYDDYNKTITITASGENCFAMLFKKGIPLTVGHTYRFSFDASSSPRSFVGVSNVQSGWNGVYNESSSKSVTIEVLSNSVVFNYGTGTSTQELTISNNTAYLFWRPGIYNAKTGQSITYSNIVLQDITNETSKTVPSPAFISVDADQALGNLATITKAGAILSGWDTTNNPGTTANISASTVPTADLNAHPVWTNCPSLFFDNLFDTTVYASSVTTGGSHVSNVTVDSATQAISFYTDADSSNSYTNVTNKINCELGHTYKITFDYYVNGVLKPTSESRMTVNPSYWGTSYQSQYVESISSGTVFTPAQSNDYCYIELRPGASDGNNYAANTHIEYRNIAIQDVTSPTPSSPTLDGQIVTSKSVLEGNAYGTLPTITRTGYIFTGWYTANGTRVSSSTIMGSTDVHLYSHWAEEGDDGSLTVKDSGNFCYTIVPETIYLNPTDNKSFQYYVNNCYNYTTDIISLEASSNADSGQFYFKNTEANAVKITVSYANNSNSLSSISLQYKTSSGSSFTDFTNGSTSITVPANGYIEGKIVSGSLTNAQSQSTSEQLVWKFEYTTDDANAYDNVNGTHTKTAYAYTTLYAPQYHAIAASANGCTYTLSYNCRSMVTSWITGAQSSNNGYCSFGSSSGSDRAGYYGSEPLLNLNTAYGGEFIGNANIVTENSSPIYARVYYRADASAHADNTYTQSPLGYLTFDSSRYTTLNQIPNLYLGTELNDADNYSSSKLHFYTWYVYGTTGTGSDCGVSSFSPNSSPSSGTYERWVYAPSDSLSTSTGVQYACSGSPNTSSGNALINSCYDGTAARWYYQPTISLLSGTSYITVWTQCRNYESGKYYSNAFASVQLTSVDKSTLRSEYQDLSQLNYRPIWFSDYANGTSENYNNYKSAMANAAYILGKPDATQTEINNAYDAIVKYELKTISFDNAFNLFDLVTQFSDASSKLARQTADDIFKFDLVEDTIYIKGDGVQGTEQGTDDHSLVTRYYAKEYYSSTVTAGTTYRLSMQVKGSGTGYFILCAAHTTDNSFVCDSGVNIMENVTLKASEWTTVQYDITIPSTSTIVQYGIGINSNESTEVTYKDIRLVPVSNSGGSYIYPQTTTSHSEICTYFDNVILSIHNPDSITGYTHEGWYDAYNYIRKSTTTTGYSGTNYYVGSEMPNDSLYLWSAWRTNTYTVKFNNNGGVGAVADMSCDYNTSYTMPACSFTRNGYSQYSWNRQSSGSGQSYSAGESFKNLSSTDGAVVTIYALYPANLNIDSNNGMNTSNLIYFANGNSTFTAGSEAQITLNGSYESDSDVKITGTIANTGSEKTQTTNQMLVYLVEGHKYQITFTSTNGGTDFYVYKYGTGMGCRSGRLKNPTSNGDGTYNYSTIFTVGYATGDGDASDRTWQADSYDGQLTSVYEFRMSQGSACSGDYTVTNLRIVEIEENKGVDNIIIQKPQSTRYIPDPTRVGYMFDGWSVSGGTYNKTTKILTFAGDDITMTAKWKLVPTEITYDNMFSMYSYANGIANLTLNKASASFTAAATGWNGCDNNGYYITVSPNTEYTLYYSFQTSSGTGSNVNLYAGNANGKQASGATFANVPTLYQNGTAKNGSSGAYSNGTQVWYPGGNVAYTGTAPNRYNLVYTDSGHNTVKCTFTTGSNCTRLYFGFGVADNNNTGCSVTYDNIRLALGSSNCGSITYSKGGEIYNYDGISTLGTLITPTRVGYTFAGWNTKEDGTGTPVTADTLQFSKATQIWSQWTPKQYNVSFNVNNGGVNTNLLSAPPETSKTVDGLTLTYDKSTDTYTLDGSATKVGSYIFYEIPMTLEAGEYYFNVTPVDSATLDGNCSVLIWEFIKADRTETSYGWDTKTEFDIYGSYNQQFTVSADNANEIAILRIRLYFNKNIDTLTINNFQFRVKLEKGGSNTGASTSGETVATEGTLGNIVEPTRTGYTVTGWNTKADGTGTHITKNTVLTADYISNIFGNNTNATLYTEYTPNTLKVNFNANGGSGTVSSQTFNYDATQSAPANSFTKTGYTFTGWSKTQNGSVDYSAGSSIKNIISSGETTLYAKWTANTYKIIYNGNGSTSGSMSQSTLTYDTASALTSNSFARSFTVSYNENGGSDVSDATANATFNGWSTSASGSKTYNNAQSVSNLTSTNNGTVNLYAKWTDGSVTLPTPTKTENRFIGWYSDSALTNKIGNEGATYTPTANTTLNAKWLGTGVQGITAGSKIQQDGVSADGWTSRTINSMGTASSGTATKGSGNVFTYAPTSMTWSSASSVSLNLTDTADGRTFTDTPTLKIYPQTNVFFEENADSASKWSTASTTSAGWTTIGSESASAVGTSSSSVYGYSSIYANDSGYSGTSAQKTTVSNGKNATYTFTFTGTGYDLIAAVNTSTGLIAIETKNSSGKSVKKAVVDTYVSFSDTLYQAPVYHLDIKDSSGNLLYGTYTVTVTATYSKAFDHGYATATGDDELPEPGENVDLSDILGEGFEDVEYISCDDGESIGNELESSYFTKLVTGDDTPTAKGSYDAIIDGVRVYNPAGVNISSSSEIGQVYNTDGELNLTYKDSIDCINSSEGLYFEGSGDNHTATVTEYKTKGAKTEIYLSNAQAVALKITSSTAVHVGLRAPFGGTANATITGNNGSKTITVNSATEQFYDISDVVTGDGTFTISCGSTSILAVGTIKYDGTIAQADPVQAVALLGCVLQEAASNPMPDKSDITFTLDFGGETTTDYTIPATDFDIVDVDGVWTLQSVISAEKLRELFTDLGLDSDFILESDAVAAEARYVDGEWITDKITVSVKAIEQPATDDDDTGDVTEPTTNEKRCKFCDTYELHKDDEGIIGFFYALLHFIIHILTIF